MESTDSRLSIMVGKYKSILLYHTILPLTTIISSPQLCFNSKHEMSDKKCLYTASCKLSIGKSNIVIIRASEDIQRSRTHLKDIERTEAATLPKREGRLFSSSSSSSSSLSSTRLSLRFRNPGSLLKTRVTPFGFSSSF